MVSPHLLRPFSARQLSLVSGEGRVIVFAVMGGRYAGRSPLVHVPTLARRVDELPAYVDTVVFIDEPVPDAAMVNTVDDMLAEFPTSGVDVLALHAPVTEAIKRVEGGRVTRRVDRSTLSAVRAPEVVARSALERMVTGLAEGSWVNVTVEVARSGGAVSFHRQAPVTMVDGA